MDPLFEIKSVIKLLNQIDPGNEDVLEAFSCFILQTLDILYCISIIYLQV